MSKLTVLLNLEKADKQWGDNALLSYDANTITIHADPNHLFDSIQKAGRRIESQGIYQFKMDGKNWNVDSLWHFWLGFRHPKTHMKAKITWPTLNKQDKAEFKKRLTIIDWVREVINEPAQTLTPLELAQKSAQLISSLSSQAKARYIAGDELKEQNLMGIYTVGKGSINPPVLLEIDYNPTNSEKTPVTTALVGKGITFDSGGYSLKPSSYMEAMRSDMGGAALMVGSLAFAIASGLNQRVKLYLCCAENMVSGGAFRLGDIITYRNGVTVEVENTDAEGRLVLADGLISAQQDNPKYIIDCATLTGAAKIAVGNDYHSLLSFDDELSSKLLNTAANENEAFWRLPLAQFHRSQFPSSFAQISNSGAANTAGASTAAAFLSFFVKNYERNWLHIDCSATFRKSPSALWAAGATGCGVKSLAAFIAQLA